LSVSNGNRNLLVESTHPGVHVPEPSSTSIGTSITGSIIIPTSFLNSAFALSVATTSAHPDIDVQIVTANSTVESIVGL